MTTRKQIVTEDLPIPDDLLHEWYALEQEFLNPPPDEHTAQRQFPTLKIRWRQLYNRILRYWSLQPKLVFCHSCHCQLSYSQTSDTTAPKEDPDRWTISYDQQTSTPLIQYWCSRCQTWTTETYEILH